MDARRTELSGRGEAWFLAAAAALVLAGAALSVEQHWHHGDFGATAGRIDVRFQSLRPALVGVDRVGFTSDVAPGTGDFLARVFQAQYALAPVLVDPDARDLALTIADLSDPAALEAVCQRTGRAPLVVAGPVALLGRSP